MCIPEKKWISVSQNFRITFIQIFWIEAPLTNIFSSTIISCNNYEICIPFFRSLANTYNKTNEQNLKVIINTVKVDL